MMSGCAKQQDTDKNTRQPPVSPNPKVRTLDAALYFADDQAMFLVPEIREVKYEDNLPLALAEELVKGPQTQVLFPTLPKTTRILSLEVNQGIAYVNLSSDFERDYPGGTTGESMALGSVVQTLTELEDIYAVQFLIEGKKVEALAKGHVDLNEPLNRHIALGAVEIRKENNENRQNMVEKGTDKWLLDPLETARKDGPMYGLYVAGQYDLVKKTERGEYSGVGEALVRHSYKGEKYEITLIQPEKQGAEGIWTINSIMPYGTQKEALESVLKNRILRPNQGGKVFSASKGSFHESLNLASIWKLPVVYVVENNLIQRLPRKRGL